MARDADLISAFITILLEKLVSDSLTSAARSVAVGLISKLGEINNSLTDVQRGLTDAGEESTSRPDVEEWLKQLQTLVYEIDDLLDDLAYEGMRKELQSNNITPSFFAKFIPLKYKLGHKMSSKLDELNKRLAILVGQKTNLGLIDKTGSYTETITRLGETSMADMSQSRIIGRDGDIAALLTMLFGNESGNKNLEVVSIVGMGGLGKTTLAKRLYNDEKVKDHFELMAWVFVSHEFDVFRTTKLIFQSVSGDDQTFANLDMLQVALTEKLSNKRFLLVLDNVWNESEEEWESLKRPFVVGAPGSKIIVTTRKESTARLMGSDQSYLRVHALSFDDALSLLARQALGQQNFDSHSEFKSVAERIAERSCGLPLILVIVGGVLSTKTHVEEWEKLLYRKLWDESGILTGLRLGYNDLPNQLKQIFVYCSIFLKDSVFDKDELILLWMAEGFLYESNGQKSMESLGDEYFEELRSRSFFVHSVEEKTYVMHDLVHDLAISVAGERCFTLDNTRDFDYTNLAFENVHHLSFIRQRFEVYRKFKGLLKARRLRTLLAVSTELGGRQKFFLSNKVLIELIPQLQFLRVINLSNYSITEIPQSIGTLKHLRYLNLSGTDILVLPEQVGDLYNLQSLLLRGCRKLFSLPDTLVKLINLRHLDISETPRLNKIPSGIGELTSLRTLSKVIIDGANGFSLSELKGLLNIQGQLCIEGLHNVSNAIQATEAELEQKKGLHDLEMEWNDEFGESRNMIIEQRVLEGLRPHENLRNLKILFYGGVEFPSWVGENSFVWLTELTLRGCRNCSRLPTLGHLKSLNKLFVESMDEVKIVGSELLGPDNFCHENAFPVLKVLEFKNMQGWNKWSIGGGDMGGTTNSFHCLHEISILNCPELSLVSIGSVPSLRVLHIKRCSKAVLESMVSVSSSIVRVTLENIKELTQFDEEVLEHFRAVKYLSVKRCDELMCLWELESLACKNLASLGNLEVQYCKSLVSLGKEEGNTRNNLKSVKHVNIRNCERIERYSFPVSIERLVIWDCPSIRKLIFPPVQEFQSDLKILDIQRCDNLGQDWLYNNFFSSVEYLEMGRLPGLKLIHEECFSRLTRLVIRGCENIESIPEDGFGFPGLCLTSLHVISCTNLKSFPYERLPDLLSLEQLWISNCPNLDSFPCGLWPPNLSTLTIGGLKNPMSEWKQQNFPDSLVTLYLHGENSGMVSFARAENPRVTSNSTSSSFVLPKTLSFLELNGFRQLKSISDGLKHLNRLAGLVIDSCPKLEDLPEARLRLLSSLKVYYCPKLQERCHRKKGKYWNMISQIPEVYV